MKECKLKIVKREVVYLNPTLKMDMTQAYLILGMVEMKTQENVC